MLFYQPTLLFSVTVKYNLTEHICWPYNWGHFDSVYNIFSRQNHFFVKHGQQLEEWLLPESSDRQVNKTLLLL